MKQIVYNDSQKELMTTLILHSNDNPNAIGLLTGQTGIVLTIANYARQYDSPMLEDVADFLMSNVTDKISKFTECGFSTGLCGIGWGLEYLIQRGIMDGNTNELLGEIDNRIMQLNLRYIDDVSLKTGILGIWHYVWARIQGNMLNGNTLPFTDSYLVELRELMEECPMNFPEGAEHRLINALNGVLVKDELRVSEFIREITLPTTKLGLSGGIAGYIMQNYISNP